MIIKTLLNKIHIHPVTVLYFIVSFFSGYFVKYFIIYLIICFHEICHFIMAYSFHFEVRRIELLPFGLYLFLEDYGYKPKIIDSIVILAGLCSHLFVYFINDIFFNNSFISDINRVVFVFNLLPIYPLDGYRLILILLENKLDIRSSHYLMFKISILSLCLLFVLCNSIGNYFLFSYLFYLNIINYYTINDFLRKYFMGIPYPYHNGKKKVYTSCKYLRDFDNYYIINNKIYSAEEMKFELIKSIKI